MLIDDATIFYEKCFEVLIVLLVIFWRIYLKLRIKLANSYTCLVGKTAIVTGANTGIGYVTALDLAKRGAKVILACKNEDEAANAAKSIIYDTGNHNVTYKIFNLESFKSVRNFAEDINNCEEKIDILINNAGVGGIGDEVTEDGIQVTMQVNYLAPFLLTHLLIGSLRRAPFGRIVNVASHMAKHGRINDFKIDLFPYKLYDPLAKIQMYANSKLCLIYFTVELAKKLQGMGITANVLHPGAVRTEIFRRMRPQGVIKLISKLWFKTPEEGSRTSIHLATSMDVQNISGKMFDNCSEVPLKKYFRTPDIGEIIWKQSEELVQLVPEKKLSNPGVVVPLSQ